MFTVRLPICEVSITDCEVKGATVILLPSLTPEKIMARYTEKRVYPARHPDQNVSINHNNVAGKKCRSERSAASAEGE